MGSNEEAMKNLDKTLISSPIWKDLNAVKNNRFIILEKELYHYKPNAKWSQAYEHLIKVLYQ